MKILTALVFLFLAASTSGVGPCVKLCYINIPKPGDLSKVLSPRSIGEGKCPSGHICVSNGCGTVCRRLGPVLPKKCPFGQKPLFCDLACANGYAWGSDGCPICSCRPFRPRPVDCPMIACYKQFCPNGFKMTSYGCPTCQCKDDSNTLIG